ncbi:hypothetical protein FB45DRAFT_368108 [Roridomyces roridus]|uniref:Protein kinase domain-containing protein n=1 Tax=Roridomyces roridus TaxID=1738132 RepID=A0AAD7FAU6_9AGAR|nr:hypothetical protein FB45DRAFT_368108 [Roridomyces roridus]
MDKATSATPSNPPQGRRDAGEVRSSESSVSAVFAHAKDVVINGGNFTNINHPPPPSDPGPPNFRRIPLGDLILNHEIYSSTDPSVVRLRRPRNYVRKMYSAEIVGLQSPTTVAVISGPGAEEQWQNEVARYSNIRHPNVLHLYGITSNGRIHALIFHDVLVPWRDFGRQWDTCHVSKVFFITSMKTQIHVKELAPLIANCLVCLSRWPANMCSKSQEDNWLFICYFSRHYNSNRSPYM